jgi:hypothetical protein
MPVGPASRALQGGRSPIRCDGNPLILGAEMRCRLRGAGFVLLTLAWAPAAWAQQVEAPAPKPAPAVVDPVGTFSFTTVFQGDSLTGDIVIRGEPGRYSGRVTPTSGPEPVEIYMARVEGQTLTVFGDAGDDDLIITMQFTGDRYTGSWTLGFDTGEISGARLKPER